MQQNFKCTRSKCTDKKKQIHVDQSFAKGTMFTSCNQSTTVVNYRASIEQSLHLVQKNVYCFLIYIMSYKITITD